MTQYETVFIVNPVLLDNEIINVFDQFKTLIDKNGNIIAEENWGSKPLSYPIKNKKTGVYFLIEFQAQPSFIEKLEVQYKRNENILRFLILKMDKHAIAYAQKVRAKKQSTVNSEPSNMDISSS